MTDPMKSLPVFAVVTLATVLDWAAWLGWDQKYDEHPDGRVTGPYQPWQVVGLILVLTALVLTTAVARHYWIAVLAPTAGMALSASADWMESSGLWLLGAALVAFGTFLATATAVGLLRLIRGPASTAGPV